MSFYTSTASKELEIEIIVLHL